MYVSTPICAKTAIYNWKNIIDFKTKLKNQLNTCGGISADAAPSSVITPSDSVSQVAVPAANTVLASNALAPAARQYQRPSINWGESASKSPLSYSAHIPAHIPDSMNMGGG